jgi:chromosome segregation ATPase
MGEGMNVVNLTDRINARQRTKDMNTTLLDEAIAHLQLVRSNSAQYIDADARARRAILVLDEKKEELDRVKRELKQATASRDKAMLDNEQRHNEVLREKQAQLEQLHREIASANTQLQEIEAKIPKRQAEYESYVRGIAALKRQLEVAA